MPGFGSAPRCCGDVSKWLAGEPTRAGAIRLSMVAGLLLSTVAAYPAAAAEPASPIETVVVTAEKHEEAINTIGMSIQAISGGMLKQQARGERRRSRHGGSELQCLSRL